MLFKYIKNKHIVNNYTTNRYYIQEKGIPYLLELPSLFLI